MSWTPFAAERYAAILALRRALIDTRGGILKSFEKRRKNRSGGIDKLLNKKVGKKTIRHHLENSKFVRVKKSYRSIVENNLLIVHLGYYANVMPVQESNNFNVMVDFSEEYDSLALEENHIFAIDYVDPGLIDKAMKVFNLTKQDIHIGSEISKALGKGFLSILSAGKANLSPKTSMGIGDFQSELTKGVKKFYNTEKGYMFKGGKNGKVSQAYKKVPLPELEIPGAKPGAIISASNGNRNIINGSSTRGGLKIGLNDGIWGEIGNAIQNWQWVCVQQATMVWHDEQVTCGVTGKLRVGETTLKRIQTIIDASEMGHFKPNPFTINALEYFRINGSKEIYDGKKFNVPKTYFFDTDSRVNWFTANETQNLRRAMANMIPNNPYSSGPGGSIDN